MAMLQTCLKCFVFFFTFFIWLIGMGAVAIMLYLRFDPEWNKFTYTGKEGLESYYLATYIVIASGAIMTLIGLLGCCGAYQDSQCMLCLYFVCLLIVFAAEITAAVYAHVNLEKFQEIVNENMRKRIQEDFGSNQVATESINYMQNKLSCCGSTSPTDWMLSRYMREENPGFYPETCCKVKMSNCNAAFLINNDNIWSNGCGPKLTAKILDKKDVLGFVGLAIVGVQLCGMVFTICLCCALRWQNYEYKE